MFKKQISYSIDLMSLSEFFVRKFKKATKLSLFAEKEKGQLVISFADDIPKEIIADEVKKLGLEINIDEQYDEVLNDLTLNFEHYKPLLEEEIGVKLSKEVVADGGWDIYYLGEDNAPEPFVLIDNDNLDAVAMVVPSEDIKDIDDAKEKIQEVKNEKPGEWQTSDLTEAIGEEKAFEVIYV